MLKSRRKAETTGAAQTSSPRDAARALLSMLGEGAPASGSVPDAQMRLLARDLIAQVEGKTAPTPEPEPELKPEPRRRLFSRSAPLTAAPEPEALPLTVPPPPEAPPARARVDPVAAATDLPTSYALPPRRARRSARPVMLGLGQVRKLALQGIQLGEVEHPAIMALALQGKPPLEQAVALRALPRGQARAVHRALRMMEGRE